jgi:hypothetical protein
MIRDINNLVTNGHEVSYKLLSIGTFKFDGREYIQVHCDRRDLEFSNMYDLAFSRRAVIKYIELHTKYILSEKRYGSFPPIEEEKRGRNVSK